LSIDGRATEAVGREWICRSRASATAVASVREVVSRIAEVKLSGTTRVPAETIHNLLKVKEDDYFNIKRLLEARRRLIKSNYFNEITII